MLYSVVEIRGISLFQLVLLCVLYHFSDVCLVCLLWCHFFAFRKQIGGTPAATGYPEVVP